MRLEDVVYSVRWLLLLFSLLSGTYILFFSPEFAEGLWRNAIISFILWSVTETEKFKTSRLQPEEISRLSVLEKGVKEIKSSLEEIKSQLDKLSKRS